MKKVSYLIAALLLGSSAAHADDALVNAVEAGEKLLKQLPHPPLPNELPMPPRPPLPGAVPVPVPAPTVAHNQPVREDYEDEDEGHHHHHHDRGNHYGERKHRDHERERHREHDDD